MSTISNFFGTGVIILIISYFRNCQFYVPIHKKNLTPGGGGIIQYPVKLLYTGNMPIMLFASFINNVFIISQNMSEKYKKVGLLKILGVWKNAGENAGKKQLLQLIYTNFIESFMDRFIYFISLFLEINFFSDHFSKSLFIVS